MRSNSHRHFSGSPSSRNKGFFIHPFLFLFMVNCVTDNNCAEIYELVKLYYNENFYRSNKCIYDEYKHHFKIYCLGLFSGCSDDIIDDYTINYNNCLLRVEFFDDRINGIDKLIKIYDKSCSDSHKGKKIKHFTIFIADKYNLSAEHIKEMLDFLTN
jgi:excinuclease UvrABC helicase subunit UvrB